MSRLLPYIFWSFCIWPLSMFIWIMDRLALMDRENDLDQHGEEDQGDAVVVKELIEEHQDPHKGGQEKLNSLH